MLDSNFRLILFLGLFASLILLEFLIPRRARPVNRMQRWPGNLLVTVLNSAVLMPLSALLVADYAAQNQLGLLWYLDWPMWLNLIVGLLLLDCIIYWQHRMFHMVPALWRLHRVHHADPDLDCTSGIRFHPLEIILSMLLKIGIILAFGISPITVFLFEILLSSCALFNHSNINIPISLDRWVRLLIVTPDMHRIHHSQVINETNSNYCTVLSIWDRLFGSYTNEPKNGQLGIAIGLKQYPAEKSTSIVNILLIPFKR